jgi:phosphate-selective porin OprO/OprP
MNQIRNTGVAIVLATAVGWSVSEAQSQEPDVKELLKRIEELEQKVKVLDLKRELDGEAAAEKAKATPTVSLGAGGFSVTTANSNFTFKVRGYVQTDGRFYASDSVDTAINDSFLIRRARPIFEGTMYEKFDYRVMLDFGAQSSLTSANNALLQDAYVTARLWPEFQIVAGKLKEPVGLERLQSGANLLFPERAYPTQLLPNRDVGLQLQGDLFGGLLRYEAGVFNGVADGGSSDFDTSDSDKDVAGRLFAHPFRRSGIGALEGLGIGVAGTYGEQSGSLRNYVSAGFQRFFTYRTSTVATAPNVLADGVHWRLSPQAYYYWGPFGLLAEYAISSQEVEQAGGGAGAGERERLEHAGWQVAASYFLTGEANSYRPVPPGTAVTFAKDGGWGALELAARLTQLDVDDDAFPIYSDPATSATKATTWSVGANWHLNRNLKLTLAYDHTEFDADSGNPLADEDEDVIITRVQFSF